LEENIKKIFPKSTLLN